MPSNEIWVRYEERTINFEQTWLSVGEVFTVDDLIKLVKFKLRNEEVSDKAITLHLGEEVLSSETLINGLYNTKDKALRVVVGK